jgi:hypothetical protein
MNAKNLPGIRMTSCGAVITAKVQRQLAEKLRDAARQNCRTVSGEIRSMLLARFGQELDG